MIRVTVLINLIDTGITLCRRSSRTIVCAAILSVLCLTGCAQDSPPPSRERTISLLLQLVRDQAPEMRRTAAESLGKVGDPRAVDRENRTIRFTQVWVWREGQWLREAFQATASDMA